MEKEIKELQDKSDALKLKYEQSKQPFKNGDVVKNKYGVMYLITDIEKGYAYGINNGEWESETKWSFNVNPKLWKLSTSEKWLEALTKEAVKRGFVEGAKVKDCGLSPTCKDNVIDNIPMYNMDEDTFWCKTINGFNMLLMQDGIWAEVIKEETLEELADRYFKVFDVCDKKQSFITFFNENKQTINRLSK